MGDAAARVLHQWDTEYSADAVEWCPIEGFRHVLICGTYQLDSKAAQQHQQEQEQKQDGEGEEEESRTPPAERLGRLLTFTVRNTEANQTLLTQTQQSEVAAVLDMKWSVETIADAPTLGVVNARGCVDLFSLASDDDVPRLDLHSSTMVEEGVLMLSLDWSNRKHSSDAPGIVVSDSAGRINILTVTPSGVELTDQWKAHDFEAWIAAYNCHQPEVVYTGGDDCLLKVWDMRVGHTALMTSRKHSAGVCSIQSNVHQEFTLATGSYDEHVLIWDSRSMRAPVHDLEVGGGVWRLKWEPRAGKHLLAAAMHNGFHVFQYTGDDSSLEKVSENQQHSSLAYGADWCWESPSALPLATTTLTTTPLTPVPRDQEAVTGEAKDRGDGAEIQSDGQSEPVQTPALSTGTYTDTDNFLLASCSFYDHLMQIWLN